MPNWPEDYIEFVLKDIEESGGVRRAMKAGFIERCMTRHCSPSEIHPNPEDEFSIESVGPSFSIVHDYAMEVKKALALELEVFEEPVIVEKLEEDGYMLLNGHHRWFAARRMQAPKIYIKIVNLIHEGDIIRMLEKNHNTKRVSFDLDEVLLAKSGEAQAEITDSLLSKRIKERLRTGAPEVIKAFSEKGYDVWIYTAGYLSEEYISGLLSMYDVKADVIINGVNSKGKSRVKETERVRKLLREKYREAVHIDNESILKTYSDGRSYEEIMIADHNDWANGILDALSAM